MFSSKMWFSAWRCASSGVETTSWFPTSVASSSWCVICRFISEEIQLPSRQALPPKLWDAQQPIGVSRVWGNHGSCRVFAGVSRLSFPPAPQGETFACPWRSICDSIPAGLRQSWYSCQWRRNFMTNKDRKYMTSWWFQRFFVFNPTWGNHPIWLIFFKWVETTN